MTSFIIDAWQFKDGVKTQLQNPEGLEPNTWVHLQRDADGLADWLLKNGLEPALVDAVLREDTRPRFQKIGGENFLLILRGVNLNPGEQPDDMLSLRILYHNGCLLTFRKFPFKAIAYVQEQLKSEFGPSTVEEVLTTVISQIHGRIEDVIEAAELRLDELQEQLDLSTNNNQSQLTHLHRQLLKLNRFLKPQTAALSDMYVSQIGIFKDDTFTQHFLNQKDVIFRILESIESHIEHAWVLREHIQQNLSEKMNRNTYNLSLIAGIFMPLGFLTGLMGVNLGGIPGADSTIGFAIFCTGLLAIAVFEYVILKRFKYW